VAFSCDLLVPGVAHIMWNLQITFELQLSIYDLRAYTAHRHQRRYDDIVTLIYVSPFSYATSLYIVLCGGNVSSKPGDNPTAWVKLKGTVGCIVCTQTVAE